MERVRKGVHSIRNAVGWAVAVPCLLGGAVIGGNFANGYKYECYAGEEGHVLTLVGYEATGRLAADVGYTIGYNLIRCITPGLGFTFEELKEEGLINGMLPYLEYAEALEKKEQAVINNVENLENEEKREDQDNKL